MIYALIIVFVFAVLVMAYLQIDDTKANCDVCGKEYPAFELEDDYFGKLICPKCWLERNKL